MKTFLRRGIPLLIFLLGGIPMLIAQNNTCATATAITAGVTTAPNITGGTAVGSGTLAHWYSYTPAGNGTIDVHSCGATPDTRLHIYDGCGNPSIADDDDDCSSGNQAEVLGLSVTGGTTYYIEWTDRWSSTGFDFTVAFTAAPSCPDPSDLSVSVLGATSATIGWTENGTATTWDLEYGATGFTPTGTPTVTGSMTNPHNLTGLTASTTYDVYVRADCGGSGQSGWVGPLTFTTHCSPAITTFPHTEDFTNTNPSLGCWIRYESGNRSWEFGTDGGSSINGNDMAFFDDDAAGSGQDNNATLLSPLFDITGLTTPRLTFDYNFRAGGSFAVDVWDGAAWQNVLTETSSNCGTWGCAAPSANIDVTAYKNANFQVRFVYDDGAGALWQWYAGIDDFVIEETPACVDPTALTATNVASTTADLGWTENGTATTWDIEWGAAGFTPTGTPNVTGTMTNPHNLTGLTGATQYDFYVRADCGTGGMSNWIGPFTFTTLPEAATGVTCTTAGASSFTLFTEEFDDNSAGWTGDIGNSNGDWEIPDASGSGSTGADNAHSGANYMNYEASNTATNQGSIVSPAISLAAGLDDAELSFWMHAYGSNMGTLEVGVGTSASGPFTTVFTWSGQLQTSGADPWQNVGVDLSAYVGQTIYIQFTQIDDQGSFRGDMSIDLVEVTTCLTCVDPSALTASNITTTSADLGWTENGGATAWDIEWGATGFTPTGTPTITATTTNPHNLTGLTPNNTYDYYVRANCGGAAGTSGWVGPYTFTTLCPTITVSASTVNASCSGFADGSATATPSGGTGPYTYNWGAFGPVLDTFMSPDITCLFDVAGLIATTGSVPVDPNTTATSDVTVTLFMVADIGGSGFEQTNFLDEGGNVLGLTPNSSGDCNVAGGTATFTLPLADYNTYAADGSIDFTVATDADIDDICASSFFNVTLHVSGNGIGSSVGTAATLSNAAPGTYAVMVTDANGCTGMNTSVVIGENTTLVPSAVVNNNPTCNGGTDGAATASVTGGTIPISYLWSDGQTTATATGLAAGTYDVTMTDVNGCNVSTSVTITDPAAISIAISVDANVSCNGGSDGSLTATPSNGTGPYTYLWSDGQTTATATGLVAGTYTVTVTDANMCTMTNSETVTEPAAISNLTATNITTTTADLGWTENNGATNWDIEWGPTGFTPTGTPNIVGTATNPHNLTGLTPNNTYDFYVRSDCGAGVSSAWVGPFTFTTACPTITVTTSSTDATCSGFADGTATGSASGGTGPYTYEWVNLIAGFDTFASSNIDLLFDGTGVINTTGSVPVDPNFQATGDVTVTLFMVADIGGAGFEQTNFEDEGGNVLGLTPNSAGDCNVAGGTATFTLPLADYLTYAADGSIDFTVTTDADIDNICGATGSFFNVTLEAPGLVQGTTVATTANLNNAVPGNYGLIATDANGCTGFASETIGEGATLTPSAVLNNNPTCNGGSDGSATASVVGGTAPYTYAWSNGETTATATMLSAGNPTVTITDINGCNVSTSVTVTDPAAIAIAMAIDATITCNGGSDGGVTATPSNGTMPYTYAWSNSATTASITGLTAGTYTVTVTDANMCTMTNSITVTEPAAISIALDSSKDVTCNGDMDGALAISVNNAQGLGGSLTTSFANNNNASSNYFDLNVTRAGGLAINGFEVNVGSTGSVTVSVYYKTGTWVGSESTPGDWTLHEAVSVTGAGTGNPTVVNFSSPLNLPMGVSAIYITGGGVTWNYINGTSVGSVWASNADFEILEGAGSGTTTPGGGNTFQPRNFSGSILYTAGTATYSWSNGATTEDITGLSGGTYTVTVTDPFGCVGVDSFTINENGPVTISDTVTNVTCNGDMDGAINIGVNGGNGVYTYNWSTGATTQNISGLSGGTYTVIVSDSVGCADTAAITVNEPNPVTLSLGNTGANLAGTVWKIAPQAQALGVGPGLGDISWWSNTSGDVTTRACFFDDQYVFNADGTFSNVLGADTWLEPWQGQNPEACGTPVSPHDGTAMATWTYDAATSSITINGKGAYLGLAKVYNGGELSSPANAVDDITYDVAFTDDSVMTLDINFGPGYWRFILHKVSPPAVSPVTNVSCNGGSDGSATVSATGGTTPYSYAWDAAVGNQTTATATGLSAGTYDVIVTDANSCSDTLSVTITEPTPVNLSVATATSLLSGTAWRVAPQAQALAVGPTQGSAAWWSNSLGDVTTRACFFDDEYVFNADGSFSNVLGADTWLEAWQGSTPDGCGTPVAPHDGSAMATWSYDDVAGTITINGTGAFLGLAKVYNGGELTSPANAVPSITYDVAFTGDSIMTIDINFGVGYWRYILNKVTSPPPALQVTNVTCNGGNDGSATVSATGGTAPYTYAWPASAGSQTTAAATGLSAGTYIVTVTDANSCTDTTLVTITEPTAVTPTISTQTNVDCNGNSTGSATVTATGGTGGYTYTWDAAAASQTTATATGLAAGTYSVTVTDASGCTGSTTVTITEPAILTATGVARTYTSGDNISCNGLTDGSIDLTVAGGTGPYTYAWDNGAGSNEDPSNLGAGTYNVTVTDANGCTTNASFTLTEPTTLTASGVAATYTSGDNISCNGLTDGSIDLTVAGGSSPYTYTWDNGAGSNEDPSNLGAGTYNVTVTDANGCTANALFTLTEPTALTSSAVETQQASCSGGSDGKAMVTGSGGSAPYTYQWDAAAGSQTTQEATSLAAGSYSVTVSDANNCTSVSTVSVTSPSGLAATAMVFTNVSCKGASDGSINLNVTGGTAPYTYNWSNGSTSEDLFGLSGGTYTVTVTDANGCTTNATGTVAEPTTLTPSTTITDVTCNGNSDGAIDLSVTGGTSPYTYIWNTGAITEDISNLPTGTYTVTVTDANGCMMSHSATVNEPSVLMASTSVSDVKCFGGSDGSIDLTVTGGTAPYTYNWDNGAGTSEDPSGLSIGTYNVTITDVNGCMTTASATVNEPTALSLSTVSTNITCHDAHDGTIDLTVTGGTGPYTYFWTHTSHLQDVTLLVPGTFTVTVTDANGCQDSTSVTIINPDPITISSSVTDVGCLGEATGSVDITVAGGTGAYSYSWSNGAMTEDLSNVMAGTYTVTITDANNCMITASATVAEPAMALSASTTHVDVLCNGASTGSIDLTVTGGTSPYSYSWDNGAGSSEDPSGLGAGTYNVTVTDANGCTTTASATITEPTAISLSTSVTDVTCNGAADGAVDLTVTGGTMPYTYAWSNMATTEDLSGLSGGTYIVTVTDANSCTATTTVTVGEPSALASSGTTTDVNCFGGADGLISVTITGGTAPYSYAWTGGTIGNTANPTGLMAGTYSVTATDANNCTVSDTFTVNQPTMALNLATSVVNATCLGNNDGSVDLTVTGGTAPYSYVWSNLVTIEDLTNVQSGNYSVTVTDANGCTATTTAFVAQPPGFSTSLSVTDVACHGDSTGSIDLNVSGATAPYTYLWNTGATTQDLMNVPAGTYSVTITDANGCTITNGQSVGQPIPLGVAGMVTDASCNSGNGGNDGSITVTPSGGTAPYSYAWSNGIGNTNTNSNLVAGSYDVTITDANGCSLVSTFTVGEPTLLLAVANVTTDILCEGDLGSINGIVGGGTAPYTFAWSDPNGMPITNLIDLSVPGTYTATVTDANGCTATATATLSTPIPITVSNVGVTDVACAGDASGAIGITATGGTGVLTFSWNDVTIGNNSDPSGLGAGTYIYTISDGNNCSFTDTVVINEPATALSVSTSSVADTNNTSVGTATVIASGGTAPYSYQWDAAAGDATTDMVTGLPVGTYSVTVTDDNGCTEVGTVTINNIVNNTVDIDYVMDLGIFPNPTRGQVTIEFELSRYADVNVMIYNVAGQVIQDLGHYHTTSEQLRVDMSMYADGIYFVRFIVEDEVFTRKLILSK